MKTKSWILTILACCIAAIGYATEFPTMNVIPVEGDKAMLAYLAPEAATLEVTLTDCNGEVIYFKRTNGKQDQFSKVFSFADLDEGTYCVSVNFGNRSVSRNLLVSKKQIKVSEPLRCYEPYFNLEDQVLNISLFNSPMKQVYVNIYKDGEHVNGYKLGKDLAIQKRLDLSKLESGQYEVVLTDYIKDHKFVAEL